MKAMKCRDVENNLIGYVENTLPSQTKECINQHLEECTVCKNIILQVERSYHVFDTPNLIIPDLYSGIDPKIMEHSASVIEFVPQHRILYRITASVIVIVGIGIGVLLGGKYSSSRIGSAQTTINPYSLPDYYTSETVPMDGETGLAVLYPND
jgi:predicted anti-sigma-YlaC factor YlaD